jgi:hypothetical protein
MITLAPMQEKPPKVSIQSPSLMAKSSEWAMPAVPHQLAN